MRAITFPEVKPALEWVNGRVLQKVSPKRKHSLAQGEFYAALRVWARTRRSGMVGPEWRFWVQPPGERRRPLVPDVAFLSYHRMPYKEQQLVDEPRMAPDVVVEVLSAGDRKADVAEKVRVYLAAGTRVVFLVDPKRRMVAACEPNHRVALGEKDIIEHSALPGFKLAVRDLFTLPEPR